MATMLPTVKLRFTILEVFGFQVPQIISSCKKFKQF